LDVKQQLAKLAESYVSQLPEKLERLMELWDRLQADRADGEHVAELRRLTHGLAGSGTTFGFPSISQAARAAELLLHKLQENPATSEVQALWQELTTAFGRLREVMEGADMASRIRQGGQRQQDQSTASARQHSGKRVYLAEDDPAQGRKLAAKMEAGGYQVTLFDTLAAFEAGVIADLPDVVVMDMIFPEGDLAGAEVMQKFQKVLHLPTLFISVDGSFQARLEALRAGASHYFAKPVDAEALLLGLDDATGAVPREQHRVLIVDDDVELAAAYRLCLEGARMQVKVVHDPMLAMAAIEDFDPDLVLLDVQMPGCNGMEVAAVLRQQRRYDGLPIVFLSAEGDISRQLAALHLGGDEYLTKPIEDWHLISAVRARVKRSRELRQVKQALNQAMEDLSAQKQTLDQHAIVSITDAAGNIIYTNEKFSEISQYTQDELLGRNHRMLNSGHHPKAFWEAMWRQVSTGHVWHGEVCNRGKDGSLYWVETTIAPQMGDDGLPVHYISVRTDVTRIKQTEEALRISEERLHRSQTYANIGTWDWNIQTGELWWSDRIGPLFGYAPGKLETTYDNFLAAVHPDDRQFVIDAVNSCVERGAEYDIEHRIVWPDGSIHWMHEKGDVVRDSNGKSLHMLGVVSDISPSKEIEQALQQARDEAQRANNAKSEFLSLMSHELRTPLNAILGFSQLLESDPDEPLLPSQHENVSHILKAGWHLLELINEVLDLARVESGKLQLSLEAVDWPEILQECLMLIAPMAEQRGIEIEDLIVPCVCDQCLVRADRVRLKQVLLNLLSNAVKYNREAGKITISCFPQPEDEMVRISVLDTGAGISSEHMTQMFRPFNRLGAENSEVEGTGIGLVVTKRLVELMGGTIEVESRIGEGSRFSISLARMTGAAATPVAVREAVVKRSQQVPTGEMKRVLYVEDNPANLRLVQRILARRHDIELISVPEGSMGVDMARSHQPDLVLLDINLPDLDGYQVLTLLRSHPDTAHVPVIALSANAMDSDIRHGLAAGFDSYLTKPVQVDALLDTLDALLQRQRREK